MGVWVGVDWLILLLMFCNPSLNTGHAALQWKALSIRIMIQSSHKADISINVSCLSVSLAEPSFLSFLREPIPSSCGYTSALSLSFKCQRLTTGILIRFFPLLQGVLHTIESTCQDNPSQTQNSVLAWPLVCTTRGTACWKELWCRAGLVDTIKVNFSIQYNYSDMRHTR